MPKSLINKLVQNKKYNKNLICFLIYEKNRFKFINNCKKCAKTKIVTNVLAKNLPSARSSTTLKALH